MRTRMVLAAVACLAAAVLAPAQPAGNAPTSADLAALVKDLQANADAWDQEKPIDKSVDRRLKGVWYDLESVKVMEALLKAERKPPAGLYVANRLLQPLLMARQDVVRQALPGVKDACQRMVRYEPLPQYTAAELEQFRKASPPADTQPAASRPRQAADVYLEQKLARERALMRHNEQVRLLHQRLVELMLLADQQPEDQQVVEMLTAEHQQNLASYEEIAQAVATQSQRMTAERAKWFYQTFLRLADSMPAQAAACAKPWEVLSTPTENPTFATIDLMGRRVLLSAVNQLAPAAKLPAMKVPASRPAAKNQKK